ncbi:unnamed protein product [Sympodiomycopsis kandeliae]
MVKPIYLSFLTLLLCLVPAATAWGAAGHTIVATLAQSLLHPSVRSKLCEILPEFTSYTSHYPRDGAPHKHCHLATLSSWPDTYKFRIPWSAHYHYINPLGDFPPDRCTFGEDGGFVNEENVLTSLVNYTRQVKTAQGYDRDVALRFVTHLMGDLHQPLHLTGRQRGGNDVWVRFQGRKARLHSVWDGLMLNDQIRELSNYTTPLPSLAFESALRGTVWDAYMRWIAVEGLGIVKGQQQAWWQDEWQEWAQCPESAQRQHHSTNPQAHLNVEHHSTHLQTPFNLDVDMAYDGPTWHVDETDLPICPLTWSKPMHPLVCQYAFAEPVAHHNVTQLDDDTVDAERRRRRGRRPQRPPNDPHKEPEQLPELEVDEYYGRIKDDKVLQRQLAMGGVRLAAVLNSLLLDE